MFGSTKISEQERKLLTRINQLTKEVEDLKSRCSYLVLSSKRWAKKFANPLYRVPEKVIADMKREFDENEQRARAKLDELTAKNALLLERIMELTEEQASDLFGSATGNSEITFEEATSHINSQPKKEDRKVVDLELSKAWSERMNRFAKEDGAKSS